MGLGSIPGWGTKILKPMQCWGKKRKMGENILKKKENITSHLDKLLLLFIFLGSTEATCRTSSTGIKPVPSALEAWSLNHWTTREVQIVLTLDCPLCLSIHIQRNCNSCQLYLQNITPVHPLLPISTIPCCSVAKSHQTLCDPVDCIMHQITTLV